MPRRGELSNNWQLLTMPLCCPWKEQVLIEIKRQTQLDQALYKAASKIYLEVTLEAAQEPIYKTMSNP